MAKKKRVRARQLSQNQKDLIDFAMLQVLEWECQGFIVSVEKLNEALNVPLLPSHTFMRIVWVLDFAANIAKILWGRPRFEEELIAKARTRRLRKRLGIARDPILNNTLVRNALEHVDARLDGWGQTTRTFNLAMFNLGPRDWIVGLADDERFMEYDPITHEVRMLRESINLQALVHRVSELHVKVTEEVAALRARNLGGP
jgi:hypothetical protein